MDLEFLLWVGFLIVYGLIQSLGKKKKQQKQVPPDLAEGESRPPTLQDALREIQEAFQEAQTKRESPEPEPQAPTEQPARTQLPRLAPTPSRAKKETTIEPEFHSLEGQIPERRLESKTTYSEKVYEGNTLEASQTYTDSFPDSEFYDDKYSHAHMDSSSTPVSKAKKKQRSASEILRARFKDKDYLSEAFIVQDILGKPASKRNRY